MGDILILDSFNKYLETLPRDRNYPSTPFDKLPEKQEHGAIWRWLHGKD